MQIYIFVIYIFVYIYYIRMYVHIVLCLFIVKTEKHLSNC